MFSQRGLADDLEDAVDSDVNSIVLGYCLMSVYVSAFIGRHRSPARKGFDGDGSHAIRGPGHADCLRPVCSDWSSLQCHRKHCLIPGFAFGPNVSWTAGCEH